MKSPVSMILIMLTFMVPSFLMAEFPSPEITLLTETYGGSGTYSDPYVLYTNKVEWRLDDTHGSNLSSFEYSTTVKMSHHRSCAPVKNFQNMTWADVDGQIFTWEDGVCGIYHIDIDIESEDDEVGKKLFFYLKIPPVKSYSLPYRPPSGNSPLSGEVTFLNMYAGSGSIGDPYKLDGPFIRFRLDQTYDPDGKNDVKDGVMHWAIYTEGHHPVYSSDEQGEREPAKTFLYWDDVDGTVFEWDTRLRPSEDNLYQFIIICYDEWGEHSEKRWRFVYDPNDSSPPSVSKLLVLPTEVDFGSDLNTSKIEITNTGTVQMEWGAEVTSGSEWIQAIEPTSGTLHAGMSTDLNITVDRSKVAEGSYEGEILINSNNDSEKVALKLVVGASVTDLPPSPPKNVVVVMP